MFTEPSDQSQRIVDILVNHHRAARVDLLGKGMTKYTSLNVSRHDDFALHKALDKARYGYVGIFNANTQLVCSAPICTVYFPFRWSQCLDRLAS